MRTLNISLRCSIGLLVFLTLMLSGCGGGGGGGGSVAASGPTVTGNKFAPASGPGDTSNYFPSNAGNQWFYNSTNDDPTAPAPNSLISTFINGTKSVLGVTATVLTQRDSSTPNKSLDSYYYLSLGGLSYLGNNDATDPLTPQIIPYAQLLFPVQAGNVSLVTGTKLPFGTDASGNSITVDITQSIDNIGTEAINITAGNFTNALKQVTTITGTVHDAALGQSFPISGSATDWLVPGIGLVKETSTTTVNTTTINTSEDLRGYVVSGVQHGFGLTFSVASDLPLNVLPVSDEPALATDGTNFLATSEGTNGLVGMLFDAQGIPVSSLSLTATAGSNFPVEAFDGTNYWVLYTPYSGGTSGSVDTCFAKRISANGTVIDGTPITLVTVGAGYSSISSKDFAFGNTNGLLAYSKFNLSTNQHELHGVLVNTNGTVAASFPIATDLSTHLNPSVAFDGTNFFVVWQQLATSGATVASIYGVRVSTTGSVIDSTPIAISTGTNGQSSPRIAFDGTNYLAAWLDLRNSTSYPEIYGARVSTGGTLLDGSSASSGFLINGGGTITRSQPSLIFNGSEYLIMWTVLGYANSGSLGVQAARVSTAGTLPSGSNFALTVSGRPLAATSSQFSNPVMVYGLQNGAVVWFDNQNTAKILVGSTFYPF